MPVSRPILLALVGALLIAGAFLLTRTLGGDENPAPEPAAVPATSPAPTEPAESQAATEPGAESAVAETPDQASGQSAGDPSPGVPAQVERALAGGEVAVVALFQRRAADDRKTSVKSLVVEAWGSRAALRDRVAFFVDDVENAAEYLGITGALEVSRTPAIVVVRPNAEGLLLQGFTDSSTLRQHVSDALDAAG